MFTIASLTASLGVDDSQFKRGLADARQALTEFGRQAQGGASSTEQLGKALDQSATSAERAKAASQQLTAYTRELTSSRARLAEALAGEDRIAQAVAAKYNALTNAQRAELIETQRQIELLKQVGQAEEQAAQKAAAVAEQQAAARVKAAEDAAAAEAKSAQDAEKAYTALASTLTGVVVSAAAAAGAALLKATLDTDKALDQIKIGTGATGAVAEQLEASFRRVSEQVPNDLGQVAAAVTELSRRAGLSGAPLEQLAQQMLTLARLTGSNVNEVVRQSTQVFDRWGIATKDQAAALDLLFRAGQVTGASLGQLEQGLLRFGPALRGFGFSFRESVQILGEFERAGVTGDRVAQGLNTALRTLAKLGIRDAHEAFGQIVARIKGAHSSTEALTYANKIFGRGAVDIVDAIRSGSFAFEAHAKAIDKSKDAIDKAAQATDDFPEKLAKIGHRVNDAAKPLEDRLLKVLDRLADDFGAQVPAIDKFIGKLIQLGQVGANAIAAVRGYIRGLAREADAAAERAGLQRPGLNPTGRSGGGGVLRPQDQPPPSRGGPGVLPAVGGKSAPGGSGAGAPDPDAIKEAERRHAQIIGRLQDQATAAARAVAVNLYGEVSRQVVALDLYDKAYTTLTATQQRNVLQQLKNVAIEHTAKEAHDAARKAVEERHRAEQKAAADRDRQTREAMQHARVLHAQTLDLQRAIATGDRPAHAAQAGVLHPLAAPGARALEAAATREHDLAARRLAELNQLRGEAVRLENQLRALRPKPETFRPPVPAALDPQKGALEKRIADARTGIAAAKELARAQREQQQAAERAAQQLQTGLVEQLTQARNKYAELTGGTAEATRAQDLLTRAWISGDPFLIALADATQSLVADNERLAAANKRTASVIEGLDRVWQAQRERQEELTGTSRAAAKATQDLAAAFASGDPFLEAWADATQALIADNDRLAVSNKQQEALSNRLSEIAQQTAERFQELGGSTRAAASATEALARAYASGDPFLIAWADAIEAGIQRNERLAQQLKGLRPLIKDVGNGLVDVLGNALSHLDQGFNGFFRNVVQGFENMLKQLAIDYLKSELKRIIEEKLLNPKPKQAPDGGGDGGQPKGILGYLQTGLQLYQATQGAPAEAQGGPVRGGRPYWVGEEGRELFLPPPSGGTIVPHQQAMALAGAGGGNVTYNVTMNVSTPDAQSFKRSSSALASDFARHIEGHRKRNG